MKNTTTYSLCTWFGFLFILLWMTSCRSTKQVVATEKESVTEIVTTIPRDTTFTIPADSSSYVAVLAIEQGNVVVREVVRHQPGKTSLTAPKVQIKNNTLNVDCETYAQEKLVRWIEQNSAKTTVVEKPVFIQHRMTFFEELQIWTGRILFGLLILIIAGWLFRKYFRAARGPIA